MSKDDLIQPPSDGADDLFLDGPLIQVEITAPLPLLSFLADKSLPDFPVVRGYGLVDTGAFVSAVDTSVFEQLQIPFVQRGPVQTAHGIFELDRYNASVRFPQLFMERQPLNLVVGGQVRTYSVLAPDILMLVGRDILRKFTFIYDGPAARFSIQV